MSVAGYPDGIVVLYVGGLGQVFVHEALSYIEHGLGSRGTVHDVEPCPHAAEHAFRTSHHLYLPGGGFEVEHRRQVARLEPGVLQEVVCLLRGCAPGGEEMVGAYVEAVGACLTVVAEEVAVLHRRALGGLYVYE